MSVSAMQCPQCLFITPSPKKQPVLSPDPPRRQTRKKATNPPDCLGLNAKLVLTLVVMINP